LPSKWGTYVPTIWDFATFAGTLGVFFTLMFLFLRALPVVSNYEMRELIAKQGAHPGPLARRWPRKSAGGTPSERPTGGARVGEEAAP
jgi:hypothetical protein